MMASIWKILHWGCLIDKQLVSQARNSGKSSAETDHLMGGYLTTLVRSYADVNKSRI